MGLKHGVFLNPVNDRERETYTLKLFKRKRGNTAYEYEDVSILTFKGRPASRLEKKTYRVVKGVNTSQNGVTIYCSNLPNEVEPEDYVEYLGKKLLVKDIGYFEEDANYTNAGIFDEQVLLSKFPKGITLS